MNDKVVVRIKKQIAVMLAVLMAFLTLCIMTSAQRIDSAKMSVSSANGTSGDTVSINISLKNNPGIVSAGFKISFSNNLTLVKAVNGELFSTLTYIPPKKLKDGGRLSADCRFVWTGTDIADSDIKDGVMLTLFFEISENAEIGDAYTVSVSSKNGDVIDRELNSIILNAEGVVTVISGSCSCSCHKTGLNKLIWSILNLFYRIVKINQYCACGVTHW